MTSARLHGRLQWCSAVRTGTLGRPSLDANQPGRRRQEGTKCCSKARTQSSTGAEATSAAPSLAPSPARAPLCTSPAERWRRWSGGQTRSAELGGTATVAQVDALDEDAVDAHADALVRDHGTLDISINLISTGDVQGTPLVEMALADFEQPIHNAMRSVVPHRSRRARHMIRQGSGVILMFGGEGDPIRDYNIGGFQISLTAVEALRKQLASELGRHGIRVVSLLTGGVIDSIPADFDGRDELVESLVAPTCSVAGRRSTTSATSLPSPLPIRPAPSPRRRSTSPAVRSSLDGEDQVQGTPASIVSRSRVAKR